MTLINTMLGRLGYSLQKKGDGFWNKDDDFVSRYNRSIRSPMEKKAHRMYALYQLCKYAANLPGDIAEVGIYKGDSAKFMAELLPQKILHGFDTFEGFPNGYVGPRQSTFSDTSFELVSDYLKESRNVKLYKGEFPNTAQHIDSPFALVHLDPDLPEVVKAGLEFFYPKLVPGGAFVIDDYHSELWPGVTDVVDQFAQRHSMHPIVTASTQCVLFKLPTLTPAV